MSKSLDPSDYQAMLDNARKMVQQARTPEDMRRAIRSRSFWAGMVSNLRIKS